MSGLLRCAIALIRGWTRLLTSSTEPQVRDSRRVESVDHRARATRRSAWRTAGAAAGAIGIAAVWAMFWVTSIGSLSPLPDPAHLQRVRVSASPLPPTPPPRGVRRAIDLRLGPPPPPPPR